MNRTRAADTVVTDRHELVRRANVELVFGAIGRSGPVSKTNLIRLTGLSKPTVLNIVGALEVEGLIRERSDRPAGGIGRTPMVYEHNPHAAYVIGIDVGGTKISAALADLAGTLVSEVETTTATTGGQSVVVQLTRLARDLATAAGVPWSRVDAVSIGTPGVMSTDGTLDMAQNVEGLGSVNVLRELKRTLRTSVAIENDVNMAAIGELEAGVATACHTFVLIAIGTGVGAGIVIDRHLARGAKGAAGEIAYLPIGGNPAADEARRRGTLEIATAGSGVQRLIRDELRRNGRRGGRVLTDQSTARDAYDAAALGDPIATRVVRRHTELLAAAILAVVSVVDPEMVVIGGGIGSNPAVLPLLREEVDRIAAWPVCIETSGLGPRAGLIGAIHHARRSLPRIESRRVSARMRGLG